VVDFAITYFYDIVNIAEKTCSAELKVRDSILLGSINRAVPEGGCCSGYARDPGTLSGSRLASSNLSSSELTRIGADIISPSAPRRPASWCRQYAYVCGRAQRRALRKRRGPVSRTFTDPLPLDGGSILNSSEGWFERLVGSEPRPRLSYARTARSRSSRHCRPGPARCSY
jgi:hypothetical protein